MILQGSAGLVVSELQPEAFSHPVERASVDAQDFCPPGAWRLKRRRAP
jgi:hypothetical protein